MAKIPRRSISLASNPSYAGAGTISPALAASSAPAADAALRGLSATFGDIGARAKRAEETRAYHAAVAETDSAWTDDWIQRQKDAGDRPVGLAQDLRDSYAADIEKTVAAVPEGIQDQVRARLTGMQNDYYKRAAAFEHTTLIASDVRQADDLGDTLSSTVLRDPGKFNQAIIEYEAAIADLEGDLPAGQLAKLREQNSAKLAAAAVDGLALDDPEVALDAVKSGAFDDYLDADQIATAQGQLQRTVEVERRRREAEARARAAEARAAQAAAVRATKPLINDHFNSISATGRGLAPTQRQQVLDLLPDEAREQFEANESAALEEFEIRSDFKQQDAASIQATLRSEAPQPGAGFTEEAKQYERLLSAANAELKAREEDPAGYVSQFGDVQEKFAAANESQDPDDLNEALRYRYDRQQQLGVSRPQMLDNATATAHAQQIMGSPLDQRPAVLSQMQEQYGDAWVEAYADVVNAGIPAETQLLALYGGSGDVVGGAQAAVALQTPDKDLNAQVPAAVKTEIKEKIAAETAEFSRNFLRGDWTQARRPQHDALIAGMNKVALSRVAAGESIETAIASAVKPIDSNFSQGLTFFTPKEINGVEIDPDHVQAVLNAHTTPEAIEKFDPLPFESVDPSVEDPEEQRRTNRAAVDFGEWVNTPDNLGVMLTVPVQGALQPLLNKNGQPLVVKFRDAMSRDTSDAGLFWTPSLP